MLITTLLNRVEKFKSFVCKKAHWERVDGDEALVIDLFPRKNSKPVCRDCLKARGVHATEKPRLFEYGVEGVFSVRPPSRALCDRTQRTMDTRLEPMKK